MTDVRVSISDPDGGGTRWLFRDEATARTFLAERWGITADRARRLERGHRVRLWIGGQIVGRWAGTK